MNKLFLVVYNITKKFKYIKYFETEFEMDEYIRKIKYVPVLFIVEDSRDTIFDYNK